MDNKADVEYCAHCGVRLGPHRHVPWWHVHRKLYDWTLAWAYRPSSSAALMVLSFMESIIFPVPPDVLLIPLCLGNRKRSFRYAFLCSVASVGGAIVAFLIGWLAWSAIGGFVFKHLAFTGLSAENFDKMSLLFEKWNFWIVFAAGFTPLPFKVFNVFAGVFVTSPEVTSPVTFFAIFFAAATLSRSARFYLVAWLMRRYGAKIMPFIEKYFNLVALAFAALLIGGVVVARYLF